MSNILTQGQTTLIEIKDGTDGVSIVSVINYYLNTNSKKAPTYEKDNTTESTESTESTKILDISGWNTVYMEPTKEYPYSWKIEVTTWSDGHQTWTKPYLISIASEATSIKTIRFYHFGKPGKEDMAELKSNKTEMKFKESYATEDNKLNIYYSWFTDNPLDLNLSDIQDKMYSGSKIRQIDIPVYYVDKKFYYINGTLVKTEYGEITRDSTFEWIRKVIIFEDEQNLEKTIIEGGKISTSFLTVGTSLEAGTLNFVESSDSSSNSSLNDDSLSYTLYYSSPNNLALLIISSGMYFICPTSDNDSMDYFGKLYAKNSNYFPDEAKEYYIISYFENTGLYSKAMLVNNIKFRDLNILKDSETNTNTNTITKGEWQIIQKQSSLKIKFNKAKN